jgi:FkbM family methyltransferase
MSWKLTAARLADRGLRLLLSPDQRIALGNYLVTRASGDGNTDRATNGEARVFRRFADAARARGGALTVFDVGANVGDWTYDCAAALGSESRVFAFEPVRPTFDVLTARLRDHPPGPAVTPVRAALSDRDGDAPIFVCAAAGAAGAELNSLHARHTEREGLRFDRGDIVPLVRGDTYCAGQAVGRIDFLKIDTEGHEVAVLRGFRETLAAGRVGVIQFEYGGAWLDSRTQLLDAFDLLAPLGYEIGRIRPDGVAVMPVYNQAADNFRYANYLAFRPEWRDALVG